MYPIPLEIFRLSMIRAERRPTDHYGQIQKALIELKNMTQPPKAS